MDLDIVRIECDIVTDTPVQLTAALYNALRSFEAEFRASCCPNVQEPCSSCHRYAGCPFRAVFEQGLSADPEIIRRHQKPSLPFSLYVIDMDSKMPSHAVGLVVIGRAVNFVEYFHTALLKMVEAAVRTALPHVTFALSSHSIDYQNVRHGIADAASLPESVILLSGQHILQNTVHSDSVRLILKSPLRLLNNGSIAHRFDFGMFFRSQLRRCSSLFAYYGHGELDLDFARLSESAQNVAVLEDDTRYTQPLWSKRPNRAGLTGIAECAGLAEPMLAVLLLGSYFNAGKGATFGLGHYQLST